jgi:SAM-dependent methyltransferase
VTSKIGNVLLDDAFYCGQDIYSDGNVEEELLSIVKEGKDYDSVIKNAEEFAIFYHLSKEREVIVEVMDICEKDTVLEIGAGCGAITGVLAEKAKQVYCIELSKRRSMINAYRNKQRDNIEIIIGNYEEIVLPQKYDVATMIGVLEYANLYIHSDRPYHDFIKSVGNRIKEGGKLYIAIENRLGAKYFSGCKEDHAGKEFIGIEGYHGGERAKTFSYYELVTMFEECGFDNYKFYYPYPDYKFPRQIFSDEHLPQKDEAFTVSSNYTSIRNQYFDESKFLSSLVMDEEYKIFANSFLVCLRK